MGEEVTAMRSSVGSPATAGISRRKHAPRYHQPPAFAVVTEFGW